MLKLEKNIKIFIPATTNDGNSYDLQAEKTAVLDVFGGATVFNTNGLWNDNGTTYSDNIQVMQLNYSGHDSNRVAPVFEIIKAIFEKGEQLAVSIELNGTLYIIDSTDSKVEYYDLLISEL